VRLALSDGALVLDHAQRLPGRGVYVCSDACLARAKRRGGLPGAFDRLLSIDAQTVESVR
jgi:predicted RNA-binding protein YlxR (DUF448 family)